MTEREEEKWNEVLKILGKDYYSPVEKVLFTKLYEYLEKSALEQIETVIKIVKPMYEKQFSNPRKREFDINEVE